MKSTNQCWCSGSLSEKKIEEKRIKRWNEASKSYQSTMYTMHRVCFVSNITHFVSVCHTSLIQSLGCDNCSDCMENFRSQSNR